MTNLAALREKAEAAHLHTLNGLHPHHPAGFSDASVTYIDMLDDLGKKFCIVPADALHDPDDVAAFIAAADPTTVLALIAVAEAAEKASLELGQMRELSDDWSWAASIQNHLNAALDNLNRVLGGGEK